MCLILVVCLLLTNVAVVIVAISRKINLPVKSWPLIHNYASYCCDHGRMGTLKPQVCTRDKGIGLILTLPGNGNLRSFGRVVKAYWNWIKIVVYFSPSFLVEFEAFYQNKFGLAQCGTCH